MFLKLVFLKKKKCITVTNCFYSILWSNTLKQFIVKLLTNYLSVFDYFVGLALKGLMLRLVYLNFRRFIAGKYDSRFYKG